MNSKPEKRVGHSGISIEAFATELAPPKRLNTEDYDYMRDLEEKRRRNELLRKMEQEKEIKEFKKQRNVHMTKKTDTSASIASKPTISKDVSRIIKLKPKTQK